MKKRRKIGELVMQTKTLNCKVITPMFSFGADSSTPELRPTELKGLIRYVYRTTQQEALPNKLFNSESERFGSVDKASPLRLQMMPKELKSRSTQSLTLHKGGNKKQCIEINSTFDIILSLKANTQTDITWYEDMIRLSFYLSGMGKRTRRARGCVCLDGEEKTIDETKDNILRLLNKIVEQGKEVYKLNDVCIVPAKEYVSEVPRPVIQKISFGNVVKYENINKFLHAVDEAGHYAKGANGVHKKDATGSTELASPIIVSVVKVKEGYFPIYTYVMAVNKKGQAFDEDFTARSEFQSNIERLVAKK